MMRALLIAALTLTTAACEVGEGSLDGEAAPPDPGAAAQWPGGRYAVQFHNAIDDEITAVLRLPPGEARVPAVIVLHGSGGLFRPPERGEDFDPATARFERQFREWDGLIEEAGYAALFPASFYSRGSFDWNDDPLPGLDQEDRLWLRAHDAVAANRWLCRHPRVDCSRIAVIGFSNGGSTLLLSQYAGLDRHPDFPDLELPPAEALPRIGVAYYPGCGLHGFIGLNDGDYRPRSPLLMIHGERDRLLENCQTRVRQSLEQGGNLEMQIYPDVGHSFDGYPDDAAEEAAQDAARALVFARLQFAFALGR